MSGEPFPQTVTLAKPIEVAGETITEVTVREPVFGDLMAMDAVSGEVAKLQHLVAKVCEVPPSTVAKMSPNDVATVTRKVLPFFGDFLALSKMLGEN